MIDNVFDVTAFKALKESTNVFPVVVKLATDADRMIVKVLADTEVKALKESTNVVPDVVKLAMNAFVVTVRASTVT